MNMVFRIVPLAVVEDLTPQGKRAFILGICYVLVALVNLIFRISGLPELANLLLLVCFFELLSCPKVKAFIKVNMGNEPEQDENDDCSEPEFSEAKKVDDEDFPTEAECSTDDALSEVELTSSTSSAEDNLSTSSAEDEIISNTEEETVRTSERPRWADIDEEDDFLPTAPYSSAVSASASDIDQECSSEASSDSDVSFYGSLKQPIDTNEPERTLYKRPASSTELYVSSKQQHTDPLEPERALYKRPASSTESLSDAMDRCNHLLSFNESSKQQQQIEQEERTLYKRPAELPQKNQWQHSVTKWERPSEHSQSKWDSSSGHSPSTWERSSKHSPSQWERSLQYSASKWERSSPKSSWQHSSSEQVTLKTDKSEHSTSKWEYPSTKSKWDHSTSEQATWKYKRSSPMSDSKLDYDLEVHSKLKDSKSEKQSKLDYDANSKDQVKISQKSWRSSESNWQGTNFESTQSKYASANDAYKTSHAWQKSW